MHAAPDWKTPLFESSTLNMLLLSAVRRQSSAAGPSAGSGGVALLARLRKETSLSMARYAEGIGTL